MPILTYIDGAPLFSTIQEALDYGQANGLVGYHTHVFNGVIGYMAGTTHGAAASSASGFDQNVNQNSSGTAAQIFNTNQQSNY